MIDFETLGLQVDSVPINMAAVAFDRSAEENPFVLPIKEGCEKNDAYLKVNVEVGSSSHWLGSSRFFIFHFDVVDCLFKDMKIEADALQWWKSQSEDVRDALLNSNRSVNSLSSFVPEFLSFLKRLKTETGAETICLWSQGSDFDIAKLCHICSMQPKPVQEEFENLLPHTCFRDARTTILELGALLFDGNRGFAFDDITGTFIIDSKPNKEDELDKFTDIYNRIPTLSYFFKNGGASEGMSVHFANLAIKENFAHCSLYDCMRSIYNLWWLRQALDTQLI